MRELRRPVRPRSLAARTRQPAVQLCRSMVLPLNRTLRIGAYPIGIDVDKFVSLA
jgi:hypothetical protein